MSHTYAVACDPATPEIDITGPTVTVIFDPDLDTGNMMVDPPYLSIDQDSAVTVTWNLQIRGGGNADVWFDHPAISFFGENAPMGAITRGAGARCMQVAALWENSPLFEGRSFAYRVHLVRKNADGSLTPISHDPVLHNEPPS